MAHSTNLRSLSNLSNLRNLYSYRQCELSPLPPFQGYVPRPIVIPLVFHTACAAPSAFGSSPDRGAKTLVLLPIESQFLSQSLVTHHQSLKLIHIVDAFFVGIVEGHHLFEIVGGGEVFHFLFGLVVRPEGEVGAA